MRPEAAAIAPDLKPTVAEARYIGFVDELLVETKWLIVYGGAATLTGIIAAVAAGKAALWIYAGLIPLTILVRLPIMLCSRQSKTQCKLSCCPKFETAYAWGVVSFMAVLSTWTFVAFLVTDDAFTRLLALTTTISYAFGMLARSFAIDRGINAQIAIAFIPLSGAMVLVGGYYLSPPFPFSCCPFFFNKGFFCSPKRRLRGRARRSK